MLLPLNDLQGEIRGLMGRNVMRQQLQSGRIGMPSVTGAVRESGAVDLALEERNEESLEDQGHHGNRPHSPQIITSLADASVTTFSALSPLVVHYQPQRQNTPL